MKPDFRGSDKYSNDEYTLQLKDYSESSGVSRLSLAAPGRQVSRQLSTDHSAGNRRVASFAVPLAGVRPGWEPGPDCGGLG